MSRAEIAELRRKLGPNGFRRRIEGEPSESATRVFWVMNAIGILLMLPQIWGFLT